MAEQLSPGGLRALKVALRRLRATDRFRSELEHALHEKHFSQSEIDEALSFLDSHRILDDDRTLDLIREYSSKRMEGREKLRSRLLARGLSEYFAEQALAAWSEGDDADRARALASEFLDGGIESDKAYRRLLSRGYDPEVAEAAVSEAYGPRAEGPDAFADS